MADDSETPYGGEFPDVRDEAGASPKWLPGLGFAILCVLALFIAIQASGAHDDGEAAEGAAEATAQAEEAPAEEPAVEDDGPQ